MWLSLWTKIKACLPVSRERFIDVCRQYDEEIGRQIERKNAAQKQRDVAWAQCEVVTQQRDAAETKPRHTEDRYSRVLQQYWNALPGEVQDRLLKRITFSLAFVTHVAPASFAQRAVQLTVETLRATQTVDAATLCAVCDEPAYANAIAQHIVADMASRLVPAIREELLMMAK
jgi:hypothetical protein